MAQLAVPLTSGDPSDQTYFPSSSLSLSEIHRGSKGSLQASTTHLAAGIPIRKHIAKSGPKQISGRKYSRHWGGGKWLRKIQSNNNIDGNYSSLFSQVISDFKKKAISFSVEIFEVNIWQWLLAPLAILSLTTCNVKHRTVMKQA